MLVIFRGMDLLRRVERWAAPYVLVMTAILVCWAIDRAGGLGPILARTSYTGTGRSATRSIPSLTGTIAFWSTLSLNMPDFTRFGRSQREQVIGQAVALPTTMTVFAAMGITITSATAVIYGKPIWDPIDARRQVRLARSSSRSRCSRSWSRRSRSTSPRTSVSPANDFANAFPKRIDFKRGGLITGVIGILDDAVAAARGPGALHQRWLDGYGAALGVDRGRADRRLLGDPQEASSICPSLYTVDGAYRYRGGWNLHAVVATRRRALRSRCWARSGRRWRRSTTGRGL